jgi:hypothetical protein
LCQENFKSENELRAEAEKLFGNHKYKEALPLYSQLLSVYPENPVFNYRCGVCLLMGDRRDLAKPLKYLQFADGKIKNETEYYYYLAKAYQLNMKFSSAIEAFEKYKAEKQYANLPADLDKDLQYCKNGLLLLQEDNIQSVLEIADVEGGNFYRKYNLQNQGGILMIKPDFFITAADDLHEQTWLAYLSADKNTLYFASYGEEPSASKDLYKSEKDENGDWGIPEKLDMTINTGYDEDYPVISFDGSRLFFSSKGHNSMGGYDVFVSTFDTLTRRWGFPVNLDYRVNTPSNDFLFIPDKEYNYACFATDRNSLGDEIKVYKVSLIPGIFKSDDAVASLGVDLQASMIIKSDSSHSGKESNMGATGQDATSDMSRADQDNPVSETARKKEMERIQAGKLVDSAFTLLNKREISIRDLEEKSYNAQSIGNKKKIAAFNKNEEAANALLAANSLFDEDLKKHETNKAKELKTEASLLTKRSQYAFAISERIRGQKETRQQEVDYLKKATITLQNHAISGSYDSTRHAYNRILRFITLSDTLKDYSGLLSLIEKNQVFTQAEDIKPPVIALHEENGNIKQQPEEKSKETAMNVSVVTPPQLTATEKEEIRHQVSSCTETILNRKEYLQKVSWTSLHHAEINYQSLSSKLVEIRNSQADKDSLFDISPTDAKSLLMSARCSVLAWQLSVIADSVNLTYLADDALATQSSQLLADEKYPDLKAVISALESASQRQLPDLREIMLSRLPKIDLYKPRQAEELKNKAAIYLVSYNNYMDEAGKGTQMAEKSRSAKKKKKYLSEASSLESKAKYQLNLYQSNMEKSDLMLSKYFETKTINELAPRVMDTILDYLVKASHDGSGSQDKDNLLLENIGDLRMNHVFTDDMKFFQQKLAKITPVIVPEKKDFSFDQSFVEAKYTFLERSQRLSNTLINLIRDKTESVSDQEAGAWLSLRQSRFASLQAAVVAMAQENIGSNLPSSEGKVIIRILQEIPDREGDYVNRLKSMDAENVANMQVLEDALQSAANTGEKVMTEVKIDSLKKLTERVHLEIEEGSCIQNLNQYLINSIIAEQIKPYGEKNSELSMADAYLDEADFLFIKARENRQKAFAEPDQASSRYFLDDARTFEQAGIDQQKLAIEIYSKFNDRAGFIKDTLSKNIFADLASIPRAIEKPRDLIAEEQQENVPVPEASQQKPYQAAEQTATPKDSFFRIQMVTLGKEVNDEYFKGITPVIREKVPAGNAIRYMTGDFDDYNEAVRARDNIRLKGFKDAFLVQYVNSQRMSKITTGMATTKEDVGIGATEEKPLPETEKQVAEADKSGKEPEKDIQMPDKPTQAPGQVIQKEEDQAVEQAGTGDYSYKIQLGVFSKAKSQEWINEMAVKAGAVIEQHTTQSGLFLYTAGNLGSHDDAVGLKDKLVGIGMSGVFITTWLGEKKIR